MQKPLPSKPQCVCLGIITGAHGIRGDVKLKSFTAIPKDIAQYGTLVDDHERSFVLHKTRMGAKGVVLSAIEGVTDRNTAETLKGTPLFAPRDALPDSTEDAPLYTDLLKATVYDAAGNAVGHILNVFDNGAHDVLEVKPAQGHMVLIPFAKDFVAHVDTEKKSLILTPAADDFFTL